ncbi:MAG: hypothetical protein DRN27_06470 [Thermoplasmata archaeon]|nr:MAG: hypothetical protein DRN27_06470 [Thermoplasmata archaeon]
MITKDKIRRRFNNGINRFLSYNFGLSLYKSFPRHSTNHALQYFDQDRPLTVIEIGTQDGQNALSILKTLNIKKIYLIDPYEEYDEYSKLEEHQTQGRLSKVEKIAKHKLSKYDHKIVWIKKHSEDAIKDIKEKVDFIYIDGNHDFDYVMKDLEKYYPFLKEDGIIAGHDIISFGGVAEAVIKFAVKTGLQPILTVTDFIFIKERLLK